MVYNEIVLSEIIKFKIRKLEVILMKVVVIGCIYVGIVVVKLMLNYNKDIEVNVYERNDNVFFLLCGIVFYVGGIVKDVNGLFYLSLEELR